MRTTTYNAVHQGNKYCGNECLNWMDENGYHEENVVRKQVSPATVLKLTIELDQSYQKCM